MAFRAAFSGLALILLITLISPAAAEPPTLAELKTEHSQVVLDLVAVKAKLDKLKKAAGPAPSAEDMLAVDAKLTQLHGFRLLLKLTGGGATWGSANRPAFDAALKEDLKVAMKTGASGIVVTQVNKALDVVKAFVLPKVSATPEKLTEWVKAMKEAGSLAKKSSLSKVKEACGEDCKDVKVEKATVSWPKSPTAVTSTPVEPST